MTGPAYPTTAVANCPCPICNWWIYPGIPHYCQTHVPTAVPPTWPHPAPYGCICPAGANLTCQAARCPRQPPKAV